MSFGIFVGCIAIKSISADIVNLLGAAQVLFEAAVVIFSANYIISCFCSFLDCSLCGSSECMCCWFFVLSRSSCLYTSDLFPYFLQLIKIHNFWHEFYLWVRLNISYILLSLTTRIKFILSSISITTEYWSVNYTSMYESSEWNVSE